MRKPSPAAILALLLALSWIGFLTQGPHAQEAAPAGEPQAWEYKAISVNTSNRSNDGLILRGEVGWELFQVVHHPEHGGTVYYYLRRPRK